MCLCTYLSFHKIPYKCPHNHFLIMDVMILYLFTRFTWFVPALLVIRKKKHLSQFKEFCSSLDLLHTTEISGITLQIWTYKSFQNVFFKTQTLNIKNQEVKNGILFAVKCELPCCCNMRCVCQKIPTHWLLQKLLTCNSKLNRLFCFFFHVDFPTSGDNDIQCKSEYGYVKQ